VTWGPNGPTSAKTLGGTISVGFTADTIADATQWAHGTAQVSTTVELPSRVPGYWKAIIEKETAGSPVWRNAQRQLMVSAAALGDRYTLQSAYTALLEQKATTVGDLVLASGAVGSATMSDKQAADALAPHAKSTVARYLIASRKLGRGGSSKTQLDPETRDGAIGALWTLRAATLHMQMYDGKGAVDLVTSLGTRAFTLRLIGAAAIGQYWNVEPKEAVRVWESVAQGEYKNIARAQAAQAFYNRGQYDAAADQVAKLAAELDLNALPPQLNIAQYTFSYSRRGNVGWQLAFSTWRDRVLAGNSFEHVMALLPMAQYRAGDMPMVLDRAAALAGDDMDKKLAVTRAALQFNQPQYARTLLEPMLKNKPSKEVLEIAANMAQQRGNASEAFDYLERAEDAGADEAVDIDTVRNELRRLLGLAQQVAMQTSGAERTRMVGRAMEWAKRWRAIDPGNDEVDRTIGTLLLQIGDGPGAWRQLSSIIERDPWSGAGYAAVAEQLETQGKAAEALEVWQQAVVIDQTNPTHRLRKAQVLIAMGRTAEGDALLEQIATTKWHDMWSGIVYQAKNLIERGKQQR